MPEDSHPNLAEAVAAATRRWPTLRVDLERFRSHAQRCLAAAKENANDCRLDELYLAFACADGDGSAIAIIERDFAPNRALLAQRLGLAEHSVDECYQALCHRLFVRQEETPPRILTYIGLGSLKSWLRASLVHALQNADRDRKCRLAYEKASCTLPRESAFVCPETEILKTLDRQEVGRVFAEALAALGERERNMLRFYFLEGASIDEIGRCYGIHRATAARTLNRLKTALRDDFVGRLRTELRLDTKELESFVRFIRSDLDSTLARCLGPREP